MKATVVVSCYNQDKYISECLDSILGQEVDFEFNIVVSDDCSSDGTPAILKAYSKLYPKKIKLTLRTSNVGAAENYLGLHDQAEGDIVFHFDGDDVMLPGKLQKQFDCFYDDPRVNLVFHRALFFSDDGNFKENTGVPYLQKSEKMYFSMTDLALWGSIAVHGAYAYRRSSRKTRNINREFMEWFFAMDSLSPNGLGIYIDEVLVKYRCNFDGGAYLSSRAGRVKAYGIYFRDIFYYHKVCPGIRKQLYANCLFTLLSMFRAKCGISVEAVFFIIRNFYDFRVSLLYRVFKMRWSVAPEKRIR